MRLRKLENYDRQLVVKQIKRKDEVNDAFINFLWLCNLQVFLILWEINEIYEFRLKLIRF